VILGDKSEGAVNEWLWDFGDGTEILKNTDAKVRHTYQDTGYYNVCLTIKNASGEYLTDCRDVRIGNAKSEVVNSIQYQPFTIEQLSVYPNPTTGQLFINLSTTQKLDIKVYDMTGKQVISKNGYINDKPLDVSSLSYGLYKIVAMSGSKMYNAKFVRE